MNSKIVKILSVFFLVILLSLGSLAFYVHKKLEPESLKKEVISIVHTNFPKIKLSLEDLKVKLGLTTNIEILGVSLDSKLKNDSRLLNLGKATLKIPLLNILTGGGTIKVDIAEPKINFVEQSDTSNWAEAFKKESAGKEVETKTALPVFLASSQVNAELKKLKISYIDKEKKKSHFSFETIQLKDIGIKRPMAFKIVSDIELRSIKFNLDAIGEFNLKNFIEDKVVRAKILAKINNLSFDEKKLPTDEIVSDIKLLFRKDKSGKIDLNIKSEDLLKSKISIFILKDEIKADVQAADVNLQKITKALKINIEGLSYNDAWIRLKGIVRSSKMEKLTPDLDLFLTKSLFYKAFDQNIEIEKTKLSLKGSELLLMSSIKAMKGRIDFTAKNRIDINKAIDFSKLETTKASLVINGLEIPEKLLKPNSKKETKKKEEKESQLALIPLKLSLELKNILLGTEVISGNGEVLMAKESLAIKGITLKHEQGILSFDSTSKNLQAKARHSFNLEAKKINASLFDLFLDKASPKITGLINASAVGKISGNGLYHDVFIKGYASRGELKNYDLSGLVNAQVEKLNSFPYFSSKPIKKVKIPQDYERINFDINAKPKKINLKKITFVGIDKKIELKTRGVLRPKGNSEVYINLFDKKGNYLKFLKKNFQTTSLPMRLEGTGYELEADYNYTSKILLSKIKKVAKAKLKKKAKRKVKQELKKLEKKILKGKKAKDLLKDIFK